MNHSIKPGQVWLDTDGNRIQAHGGSILAVGDTFYWYGENKERTTGKDEVWHWGVRCYSSKDLYNWQSEGIIIPPEPDDLSSPLHPYALMDRPHIVYNEKTGKYVAWLKIMGESCGFAVLQADRITGPYEMVNRRVNPCGLEVGDFDIQVDQETKKAYLFSECPHTFLYSVELNETYTDAEGGYTRHFPREGPPDSREAPAHFMRNGLHYLITSGTSGYFPNPSEAAVAGAWHGPYTVQGNPHVDDESGTSFNSQISSVFRHPAKKDLYIALADRWKPELPGKEGEAFVTGRFGEEIREKFRKMFDPQAEFIFTEEDAREMRINSSVADYVWLPLSFENDRVRIVWKDEWRTEDYETV